MTIYKKIKNDFLAYSDESYKKIIQGIIDYNTSNNGRTIKVLELGGGQEPLLDFF